jgi:glycerate kinase
MSLSLPHRVLVAPSGFKESLSASEVADAIAAGVRRVVPGVHVITVPVADGGEGTATTLAEATGGDLVDVTVTGPVGKAVRAHFARLGGTATGTCVVEMAAAAGLRLVPRDHRDPTRTTTYGVGELIASALDTGCERIIVGCGDSGTSDGGAGALTALGARITDSRGRTLKPGGAALADAAHLDLTGLHPRLADVELVVACNPHNVLCGKSGVARVFGPQKGATLKQVTLLAKALKRWSRLLAEQSPHDTDYRRGLGTGASGGLGAGLAAVGARLVSRFDVFLDSGLAGIRLDELVAQADLVITAEGAIDFQTPRGKVPAEVARRAKRVGTPVLAMAGSLGRGAISVHDVGIDAMASIIPLPMPLEEAVADGARLLTESTERTMRLMLLGATVSDGVRRRSLVAPDSAVA